MNPLPVVPQSIKSVDSASTTADAPTSLYKYYDEFGILIYIGITANGMLRNRQHNSDKAWWPFVTRQEVEHLPTRDAALDRERELIESLKPPFNRQHNSKHIEHKSVYPAIRAEMSDPNVGGLVYSRSKRLALECDRIDGRKVYFSTHLSDAAIARHMVFSKDPKLVIFDNQNARIGKVIAGATSNGRFSLVAHLDKEDEIQTIRGAFGTLIVASIKKPIAIKFRTICAAVTWDLEAIQNTEFKPPKPPAWTAFTFENMRGRHVDGWDVVTHIGKGDWQATRVVDGELVTGVIRLDWLGRLVS